MNWDEVKGNWTQLRGKVREQWGRLTDDEIDDIAGRRDQLVGKLQQVYGKTREQVESEVDAFSRSCSCDQAPTGAARRTP